MIEKDKAKEISETVNVTVSVEENNKIIVDAIDKLSEVIPTTAGTESLIEAQNIILSSLIEVAKIPSPTDYIPYLLASISILISLFALYITNLHKTSKSVLCLNSRLFDSSSGEVTRILSYTYSNTGNQELFVKYISLLSGQSLLGNLKDDSKFLEIPSNAIEPFIIKPGEIKTFDLIHNAQYDFYPGYDLVLNKYIMLSLEVMSADGSRYQVIHDISKLESVGPGLEDKVWSGVPLGNKIK